MPQRPAPEVECAAELADSSIPHGPHPGKVRTIGQDCATPGQDTSYLSVTQCITTSGDCTVDTQTAGQPVCRSSKVLRGEKNCTFRHR